MLIDANSEVVIIFSFFFCNMHSYPDILHTVPCYLRHYSHLHTHTHTHTHTDQYDATLGSITISSIHNPRVLIDLKLLTDSSVDDSPPSRELTASRFRKMVCLVVHLSFLYSLNYELLYFHVVMLDYTLTQFY